MRMFPTLHAPSARGDPNPEEAIRVIRQALWEDLHRCMNFLQFEFPLRCCLLAAAMSSRPFPSALGPAGGAVPRMQKFWSSLCRDFRPVNGFLFLRSKTQKRLKERFLMRRNKTKRAKFRGNPLFQATYNYTTENS